MTAVSHYIDVINDRDEFDITLTTDTRIDKAWIKMGIQNGINMLDCRFPEEFGSKTIIYPNHNVVKQAIEDLDGDLVLSESTPRDKIFIVLRSTAALEKANGPYDLIAEVTLRPGPYIPW